MTVPRAAKRTRDEAKTDQAGLKKKTLEGVRKRSLDDWGEALDETAVGEVGEPCHYTGSRYAPNRRPHGLDRKDNSQGYNKGNAVSCSAVVNVMKGTMSEVVFRKVAKRMLDVMRGRGVALQPAPAAP